MNKWQTWIHDLVVKDKDRLPRLKTLRYRTANIVVSDMITLITVSQLRLVHLQSAQSPTSLQA